MKKIFSVLLLLISIAIAIVSCTKSSDTTSGTSNIVAGSSGSFQGAGSKWVAVFTDTTFNLQKFPTVTSTTADLTINGTYVQYTSGFRKLTVTSATGTSAPSVGSQAYGFDVPGFAFFLKPIESDSEPIVMLSSGSCPSSGFNGNWITAKFDDGKILDDTVDNFGTAVFNTSTPATSTATINQLSAVTATSLGSSSITFNYTTCSNSVLTFTIPMSSPVETVDMFFTSAGGALVHSYNGTTHDSIIFASPKHTADITQSEIAGTYSVLVFDDSAISDKLFPASLTIPASGNGTANKMSNVETGAFTSDPAIPISSITAIASSNGLFTASIDPTGDNGRLSCAYFVVSTTKVISCNGYGSSGGSKKPFFFLAKSR